LPVAQDLLGGHAVNTKNRVELARGVARFFIRTSRVGEIWGMVASFRRPRPWLAPALVDLCRRWPVRTGVSDWLHPWSKILTADMMQPLLHPVLTKIGQALNLWNNVHDMTVYAMLLPWRDVLTPQELETFVQQTILPKLYQAFKGFIVNPSNQDMAIWNDVMKWRDLFQNETFVVILMNEFFPKWLTTLHGWLSCSTPNFEEVSRWYIDWKKQIPEEIATEPHIVHHFNMALEIMQTSMGGKLKALPSFTRTEHIRIQNYKSKRPAP